MQHALDLARPYWPLILAAVVWPIIGAALSWWLWWDTPAHWDAYAAAHPGRALAIRALRTVSPHLRKLVVAWRDYAASRSLTMPAAPPSVGPLAPSADPVAPPVPTPTAPAPVASDDGTAAAYELARREVAAARVFDPLSRQTIAPEVAEAARKASDQAGHVAVRALLALVVGLSVIVPVGVALTGCPPPPPADGGVPVVTPSDWTRTARLSVTVGRGLIVVARPIVETLAVDPGRTRARRAFDAADQALAGLDRALVAYEARGGDRCVAYAATGAAIVTLHELAQVLADNGIAIGVPISRVVDLVASVADTLIPACQSDAGFASVGGRSDATLRAIEDAARARGVILRRDLDGIAPALDGGL